MSPTPTRLTGRVGWHVIKVWKPAEARFRHWLTGGGKVEPLEGDKDVFGDGRVKILQMPGHTEGHQALLVRLASGPVLISGDQYHRSDEHTSELQSLMRISYAVFCLKKKNIDLLLT